MKMWERFDNWQEAVDYFDRNVAGAVTKASWSGIGNWLYMEYVEGESRLDFLKRCQWLTAAGRKEVAKLEKAAGGAKVADGKCSDAKLMPATRMMVAGKVIRTMFDALEAVRKLAEANQMLAKFTLDSQTIQMVERVIDLVRPEVSEWKEEV